MVGCIVSRGSLNCRKVGRAENSWWESGEIYTFHWIMWMSEIHIICSHLLNVLLALGLYFVTQLILLILSFCIVNSSSRKSKKRRTENSTKSLQSNDQNIWLEKYAPTTFVSNQYWVLTSLKQWFSTQPVPTPVGAVNSTKRKIQNYPIF